MTFNDEIEKHIHMFLQGEVGCSRQSYAEILKCVEKMKTYPVPKVI